MGREGTTRFGLAVSVWALAGLGAGLGVRRPLGHLLFVGRVPGTPLADLSVADLTPLTRGAGVTTRPRDREIVQRRTAARRQRAITRAE